MAHGSGSRRAISRSNNRKAGRSTTHSWNRSMGACGRNVSTPTGSCLWPTPGTRSRRGERFTTRAARTRPWETVHHASLLHWPGLTPANEARMLTIRPAEKPGYRQILSSNKCFFRRRKSLACGNRPDCRIPAQHASLSANSSLPRTPSKFFSVQSGAIQ